jgi:hypothetical protein
MLDVLVETFVNNVRRHCTEPHKQTDKNKI